MKEIIKKYWYLVVIVLCIISLYYVVNQNNSDYEIEEFNIEDVVVEEKDGIEEVVSSYYVDIKGEVLNPGVYEISKNSRIIDVINKAGGLTKNADVSLLNLSKKVIDEMNIKIYSKNEVKAAKENLTKEREVIEIIKEIEKECICPDVNVVCSDSNKNDAVIEKEDLVESDNIINKEENNNDNEDNISLININSASKEELMSIPNIGESKADKIIEYRNTNKFEKIEDIQNVSGIGEAIFEKIKDYITV